MKICVLIELVCEKQKFLAQMQLRLISFALFKLSERNRIVQMHNAAISFTLLLFAAPLCLFLYLLAFYFCPFLHIAQQLKLIYAVETERQRQEQLNALRQRSYISWSRVQQTLDFRFLPLTCSRSPSRTHTHENWAYYLSATFSLCEPGLSTISL